VPSPNQPVAASPGAAAVPVGASGTGWRRALGGYVLAAGLAVVLAFLLLHLWGVNLRVPFDYRGDALFFGMLVKSLVDGGWYLTNAHLGAPGVLELHDFPLSDAFHLGVLRLMTVFSRDWALVFNLYYLAGFPLIALSALAVFRHFRIAYAPALACSLLYAFSGPRLLTGESHLFLAMFYELPLGILVALWVMSPSPPLGGWGVGSRPVGRRRVPLALAICALTATTGIYYAFFVGVLIFLGGLVAAVDRRRPANALAGALLTASIVAVLALQAAPTVLYRARHGSNPQVAERSPQESEIFGMRIARLLLPVDGHRIEALRLLKERSDRASALPRGESTEIGLGAIGSIGFLILLGTSLVRPRRGRPRHRLGLGLGLGPRLRLLRALASLNLLALLVATTGGFGYLMALLVTPAIRTYARMSVVVAFLSLFAVALTLDRLCAGRRRRVGWLLSLAVAAVGLFDQVTPAAVRWYSVIAAQYGIDAAFVQRLEERLPAGAMIFELPYLRCPEAETVPGARVVDYDPLRLYLHATTLRWSYPTVQNRPTDAWTGTVAQEPPAALVETVSAAGFAGVLVDRYGYPDSGVELESALGARLGAPLLSGPGYGGSPPRFAFFGLAAYDAAAEARLSPADRVLRRRAVAGRVVLRWLEGFHPPERGPNGPFRWSSGLGLLEIDNPAPEAQSATLTMTLFAGVPPATLRVDSEWSSEELALPPAGITISRTFRVPPGRHLLRMRSDGAPVDPPLDPRRLVWRMDNPRIQTAPATPGAQP
jgi:phosphoglycerol transferase